MNKKVFILMLLACCVLGGTLFMLRSTQDRVAPEISFPAGEANYETDMDDETLLKGVTAMDEKDGDVSDTLVVENVFYDQKNGLACVMYAAKDSQNNVAKAERQMTLRDWPDEETETETESESEAETESSVRPQTIQTETESETATETESEEETEELPEGAPRIKLKQRKVELELGESFDPVAYVDTITDDYDNIYDLWRSINVTGEVNSNVPGIYQLVYTVNDSSGFTSNRAMLLVVVKGDETESDSETERDLQN